MLTNLTIRNFKRFGSRSRRVRKRRGDRVGLMALG